MAIADVSPAYQEPVGPALQGAQKKMGRYGGRTHHPHGADIGRVLQTADAGQVRGPIRAPVAQKSDYFGFESGQHLFLSLNAHRPLTF
jgi:hypothetical protein